MPVSPAQGQELIVECQPALEAAIARAVARDRRRSLHVHAGARYSMPPAGGAETTVVSIMRRRSLSSCTRRRLTSKNRRIRRIRRRAASRCGLAGPRGAGRPYRRKTTACVRDCHAASARSGRPRRRHAQLCEPNCTYSSSYLSSDLRFFGSSTSPSARAPRERLTLRSSRDCNS